MTTTTVNENLFENSSIFTKDGSLDEIEDYQQNAGRDEQEEELEVHLRFIYISGGGGVLLF